MGHRHFRRPHHHGHPVHHRHRLTSSVPHRQLDLLPVVTDGLVAARRSRLGKRIRRGAAPVDIGVEEGGLAYPQVAQKNGLDEVITVLLVRQRSSAAAMTR